VHNEPPAELPRVAITRTAEVVTVVLSGEFDVTNESILADCLAHVRRERPRRLVFDAEQVTFIDCASARLITGAEGCLPAGVKPVIARPSLVVRRVLRASGLGARCELQSCG
jgi:anti-anti-sigma factor